MGAERNHNGRWKWIAGAAVAALMMVGSGAGSMAWSAYETHDRTLGKHGEAIVRLVTLAEAQQGALERIEKALAAMPRTER